MKAWNEVFAIVESAQARQFAEKLFYKSFRQPFPVSVAARIGDVLVSPKDWRQFVALYERAGEAPECVGFVNYIRFKNVYLTGGLCVKTDFYRRCPREYMADLKSRGGLAKMLLDAGAELLTDCIAHFGYCGDPKARQVIKRAGYRPTSHRYLFVKPVAAAVPASLHAAFHEVEAIGPF